MATDTAGADQPKITKPHELLDAGEISRALTRIAHQIVETNNGADNLVVVGIQTRGVPLANRLAGLISSIENVDVPSGCLDVTMYRDDLRNQPTRLASRTELFPLGGKTVVLVDDVLNSGRTVVSALEALKDYGRAAKVQLAVLVDRGNRELPIQADQVGKTIPTSASERVSVHLTEVDGYDQVTISRIIVDGE